MKIFPVAECGEAGRGIGSSPLLGHLFESQPGDITAGNSLDSGHQHSQTFVSHLLQETQQSSFKKHLHCVTKVNTFKRVWRCLVSKGLSDNNIDICSCFRISIFYG